VLVERVEGFCTETEWRRAYREINEFEEQLSNFGAVVVKFWLQISKEEQLRRFEERPQLPHKKWKITDEDWRNREKWDSYLSAVNEMLYRTSTNYAPWTIIESNSKHFARIKVLKTVIAAIEAKL
ncbi:MAG: phosphate--AMP phosphotransferase, partial [bacterium]